MNNTDWQELAVELLDSSKEFKNKIHEAINNRGTSQSKAIAWSYANRAEKQLTLSMNKIETAIKEDSIYDEEDERLNYLARGFDDYGKVT